MKCVEPKDAELLLNKIHSQLPELHKTMVVLQGCLGQAPTHNIHRLAEVSVIKNKQSLVIYGPTIKSNLANTLFYCLSHLCRLFKNAKCVNLHLQKPLN